MNLDREVIKALAPTGVLRASINLGNPILANTSKSTGEPEGVSIDLARAFAQHLGVDVELVVFDAAGRSVQAVASEQADIGFFAIDPVRGAEIAFSAAYVLIEGSYLVREESPLLHNDEVDRDGCLVAVGKGSAYDLFLTRELKHAHIVRAPTSPTVVQTFLEQELDVAAGVKQQLESDCRKHAGLRLLPGRFMVIRQAMGVPKTRGAGAARALHAFVEEMKDSGSVADALQRHSIEGASVAPNEA
ncbi:ABC transporter substrate-binding protein [Variovorax sp. LjRoot84]|uniref:ABC transporter substrate-binding protein n=1 Tax=Variovorax sp. LjRoot84 TaxID=3342340 RepID=UPI003ED028AA